MVHYIAKLRTHNLLSNTVQTNKFHQETKEMENNDEF